jgi:outer membrane lipoprotein SlyB
MKQAWRVVASVATVVSLSVVAACSTTSPDVIKPEDAQRMSRVEDAVVLSVRPVVVEGSQSGMGAATGAVLGGAAGLGGSSNNTSSAMLGVAGAVVGGIVGNAAERFGTREDAFEILVQLSNGSRRAIVQAKGNETFNPGDPVILVTTGGKTRVMLAPKITKPGNVAPAQSR